MGMGRREHIVWGCYRDYIPLFPTKSQWDIVRCSVTFWSAKVQLPLMLVSFGRDLPLGQVVALLSSEMLDGS